MVEALNENPKAAAETARSPVFWLIPALRRLDGLLERAISAAQAAYGAEAAADRFRGLYISALEAERLLRREPANPILQKEGEVAVTDTYVMAGDDGKLSQLQNTFGLSDFDLDLLLIGLAPELDLRYERLYAYLQDDVTRRRPSVDLALNLLCPTAEAKLLRRCHFLSSGPLVRHKLVHLVPDGNNTPPPLLSQYFKVDDQIISWLLGQTALDSRLSDSCRLVENAASRDEALAGVQTKENLRELVRQSWEAHKHLLLLFHGPSEQEKSETAEALACAVEAPLLIAELLRAPGSRTECEDYLRIVFREAWRHGAVLCLRSVDALPAEQRQLLQQNLSCLMEVHEGITILCAARAATTAALEFKLATSIFFPTPDFALRQRCWQTGLANNGVGLEVEELNALAARFRLTAEQIADAVEYACNQARLRGAGSDGSVALTAQEVFAAARAQCGEELGNLARKLEPHYRWDDLVLPDDSLQQLREICCRVAQSQRVFEDWGFGQKLSYGKGTHALFSGPSGTGKTMAAEVMANELRLDLHKIDLSGIVSKYIGETEKNLDRVFAAAEDTSAVLFFHESDAPSGNSSYVRDSHDRYANLEISYLLQKMEEYESVAILATNLRANMDDAFLRRLK